MATRLRMMMGLGVVLGILALFCLAAPAQAGSGRSSEITVQNTTGRTCLVALYGLEQGISSAP